MHSDENEPDPTADADWVTFYFVLFGCSYLIIGLSILWIKHRSHYAPLKTLHPTKLTWLVLFGIVHIIGTFVANDHFAIFIPLLKFNCELWTFWIQYLLGLNAWFIAFILRILECGYVFNNKFELIRTNLIAQNRINWGVKIGLTLPVLVICIGISATHASQFSDHTEECTTGQMWSISLVFWLIYCILVLVVLTVYVKNGFYSQYLNEVTPLIHIVILCIVIVIIDSYIHFAKLYILSVGRSVSTASIVFLHIFCFTRLVGFKLWKAMKNDKIYIELFTTSVKIYEENEDDQNRVILEDDQEVLRSFLNYCDKQRDVKQENSEFVISPKSLAECYSALYCFETSPSSKLDKQEYKNEFSALCDKYFSMQSSHFCGIDPVFIFNNLQKYRNHKDIIFFSNIRKRILDALLKAYLRDYTFHKLYDPTAVNNPTSKEIGRLIELSRTLDPSYNVFSSTSNGAVQGITNMILSEIGSNASIDLTALSSEGTAVYS